MANGEWRKTSSGAKAFVPMLAISTAVILGYALLVKIFVMKEK